MHLLCLQNSQVCRPLKNLPNGFDGPFLAFSSSPPRSDFQSDHSSINPSRSELHDHPKAISCPSPKEEIIHVAGCNSVTAKRISVIAWAKALISIESATLQMKEQPIHDSFRIHGLIKAITWGGDICLYQRTLEKPDIVGAEGSFNFPLTISDWSLSHNDVPGFEFCLYEGDGSEPILHQGFMCIERYNEDNDDGPPISANGRDKVDDPIVFIANNDRATFTFTFTRIGFAYTAYVSFRVVNCDNKYYKGQCNVSGTIKAKQVLWNGVSRVLTLFSSSSGVDVPQRDVGRRSIPLLRPVIVVPVQTQELVDAKQGGYVELEFDLDLATGNDSTIIQGKANLILQPHHKPEHPFYLIYDEISRKRKSCSSSSKNVSVPDDGIKIRIMVTPFNEYSSEYSNENLRQWAL